MLDDLDTAMPKLAVSFSPYFPLEFVSMEDEGLKVIRYAAKLDRV